MKLTPKVGINPEYWAKQSVSDFVSVHKGKFPDNELKQIHKNLVKAYGVKPEKKQAKKEDSE